LRLCYGWKFVSLCKSEHLFEAGPVVLDDVAGCLLQVRPLTSGQRQLSEFYFDDLLTNGVINETCIGDLSMCCCGGQ
jgi:hypothetical protein